MGRRKKKTKALSSAKLDSKQILDLFRKSGRPMSRAEVMRALKWPRKQKADLRLLLKEMAADGKLIRIRRGYGLPEMMRMVTGRLEVLRTGQGFVIPEDKRRRDVFVAERDMHGAWHGDRVVVAVVAESKSLDRKPRGRIVRVLERGRRELAVRAVRGLGRGVTLFRPTDARLDFSLTVETGEAELNPGDVALVRPGEQVENYLWEAELVEVLGPEMDLAVQEKLVKATHKIRTRFPSDVREQAEKLPELPDPADFAGREDLRSLGLVTIDGATAKDFDDAIHVKKDGSGYVLTVAIADVSHYVAQGSALDREAQERGNSYYFPKSVEPMLPERLSNGLCSLNPDVPRLCMVAQMRFSARGERGEARVMNAVMQSSARLTYAQAKRALLDGDKAERENIAHVLPMLETALELARKVHDRRRERGGLDFDLPEPEIMFNLLGETVDIRPRPRHFGHQLIEEFMIAANEAVAEYLRDKGLPCVYRIHPAPDQDKLRGLFRLVSRTEADVEMPRDVTPKTLQKLVHQVRGSGLEFVVSRMLLRSMKQAVYSPEDEGHFGLASTCYCHFTSPIRRYADLVVHRMVKASLGAQNQPLPGRKKLTDICGHISGRERVAATAEREIVKRATILHLTGQIGERYHGVISGLSEFGFWVELEEVMAEGMVRLSSLGDDYYAFWRDEQRLVGERTGKSFVLGQKVGVTLEGVSLDRLEVNLVLTDDVVGKTEQPGPKGPKRGKRPSKSSSKRRASS